MGASLTDERHPLGRAAAVAATLVLLAIGALAVFAPPPAVAACNPGQPGLEPPLGCQGLGADRRHAVPSPGRVAVGGGRAPIFSHEQDACAKVARWAPAHRQERYGIRITFYWAWVRGVLPERPELQYLVCGGIRSVRGFTRGPGEQGQSLPCPFNEQLGRSRPDSVGWWVADRRGVSSAGGQVDGRDRFGFWNYRLYNPQHDPVRVRLYAACHDPR